MNAKFCSNQLYNDFYAIMNNFYYYNLTSYESGTHPTIYGTLDFMASFEFFGI